MGANGGGINMTLYHVAIQPAIKSQAALKVYGVADLPGIEVGFVQGFPDGRYTVLVINYFFYGEANAVVAHALVNFQFMGNGGGHQKALIAAILFYQHYFAGGFNNACKHACKLGQGFDNFTKFHIFAALLKICKKLPKEVSKC
jgi:hypothetical protein